MIKECKLIEPFYCKKDDNVVAVAQKLFDYQQRHIYVVDEKKYPIGVISVTDLLDRVLTKDLKPSEVKAEDIMTEDIIVCEDTGNCKEAYKKMNKKGVVSCPIVEDGKYLGTLTFNEALKYVTNPDNT